MSTTVTMQLNATDVAGDWATRPAGSARTVTSASSPRIADQRRRDDDLAVFLFELRGAVESIRRGAIVSEQFAETQTERGSIAFGSPAMYHGIRFAIGA